LDSSLVGGYLSVLSVVFALFFSYLFHRDRDKHKLMFLLVFVFSVFIRLLEIIPGWENSQLLQKICRAS